MKKNAFAKGIWCLNGGSPSRLGKILLFCYNNKKKTERLLEFGNILRIDKNGNITPINPESLPAGMPPHFADIRMSLDLNNASSKNELDKWLNQFKHTDICTKMGLRNPHVYIFDADDNKWQFAENVSPGSCNLITKPLDKYIQTDAEMNVKYTVRLTRKELEDLAVLTKGVPKYGSDGLLWFTRERRENLARIGKKIRKQLKHQLKENG